MKKIYLICVFVLSMLTQLQAAIERRAAIDIGSGSTKVAIADVDVESHQIVEVLFESSFSVPYQASLDRSKDQTFGAETRGLGLTTFKKIKEIADQHQVQKIVAIATSAFRKAGEAQDFVDEIERDTGIKVQVITQQEEGKIGFFSAASLGTYARQELVVVDIGTGSVQITAEEEEEEVTVYMGEQMGSVAFKNHIIAKIQERNLETVSSPNPMTKEDVKRADQRARSFGRGAYTSIKHKIAEHKSVVGIGRLFSHSVAPLVCQTEDRSITRKALRKFIKSALNKSDQELNSPFAHVDVTNCILTLALMKSLGIDVIKPVDTTTTKGLLVSPVYWVSVS